METLTSTVKKTNTDALVPSINIYRCNQEADMSKLSESCTKDICLNSPFIDSDNARPNNCQISNCLNNDL